MMIRLTGFVLLVCLASLACGQDDPFTPNDLRTCLYNYLDCYPKGSQLNELRMSISGEVILPSSTKYNEEALMYNRNMQKNPGIIVMVTSAADIRAAILFARKYKLRVTVRSSGHDYNGRSTGDGSLNINIERMNDISVDLTSTRNAEGEVKVESGARLIDIYEEVDKVNKIVVGGSAHTVAAGGYTLGGGHSPISRTYGYAVDNLLETQIVLADGSIATCTETRTVINHVNGTETVTTDGDLFWALRGGGGGTFGVSVYFVYKLHPPSEMLVVEGGIAFKVFSGVNTDRTKRIMDTFFGVMNNLPSTYGGYFLINNFPGEAFGFDLQGSLSLFVNKLGNWTQEDADLWKPVFDVFGELLSPIGVRNFTSFLEYERNAVDPDHSRIVMASSFLQPAGISPDLSTFIHKQFFEEFIIDGKTIWLGCTGVLLGDKTKEPAVTATPLGPGYRTANAHLTCGVVLIAPEDLNQYPPDSNKVVTQKAYKLGEDMAKLGEGMYFNEPTQNAADWSQEFWGSNYPRLLRIKARFDPENFFTCRRCVGDEFNPIISGSTVLLPSAVTLVLSAVLLLHSLL